MTLSYLARVHISFSHTIHCNLHNFCWHITFPTLLYIYQHQNKWTNILMWPGRQGDGVQKFSSQFFHKGPIHRNVSIGIHGYWVHEKEKNTAGIEKGFTQTVKYLDSILRYPVQITARTLTILRFVVISLSPTTAVLQHTPWTYPSSFFPINYTLIILPFGPMQFQQPTASSNKATVIK